MPWLVRFLVMRFGMRAVRWGWQRYKSRPSAQGQAMQTPGTPLQGYGNGLAPQGPYQWQYNSPPNTQRYDNRYYPPR